MTKQGDLELDEEDGVAIREKEKMKRKEEGAARGVNERRALLGGEQ